MYWSHFIDNRTIFLVVLNMMQLALIKLIFQFLSPTTVGKVRCKLHPPVPRRYGLPGDHRKSYSQEKCLSVKESLEDVQILQKPITLKSLYVLRRIVCFWGWGKCWDLGLCLMLRHFSQQTYHHQTQCSTGSSALIAHCMSKENTQQNYKMYHWTISV